MFQINEDPITIFLKLKRAVEENKRPTLILHQFLTSGKKEANLIGNYLIDHRETVKLLTSPKGREWIHRWLDDVLNYLQKIAEEARR